MWIHRTFCKNKNSNNKLTSIINSIVLYFSNILRIPENNDYKKDANKQKNQNTYAHNDVIKNKARLQLSLL